MDIIERFFVYKFIYYIWIEYSPAFVYMVKKSSYNFPIIIIYMHEKDYQKNMWKCENLMRKATMHILVSLPVPAILGIPCDFLCMLQNENVNSENKTWFYKPKIW